MGVSGPPGLDKEIVAKWSQTLEEASKDPAFLEQAKKIYKIVAYHYNAGYLTFD
jgi:tripartite-type tricarboxylate transporter receptor subunit TctC